MRPVQRVYRYEPSPSRSPSASAPCRPVGRREPPGSTGTAAARTGYSATIGWPHDDVLIQLAICHASSRPSLPCGTRRPRGSTAAFGRVPPRRTSWRPHCGSCTRSRMCERIIEAACSAGTSRAALQPVGSPTLWCWWLRCNPGFEICRGSRERWINFRSRILAPLSPRPQISLQPLDKLQHHIHNGVEIFVAGSTDSAIVHGDVQRSSYSMYSPLSSQLLPEKIFTRDPAMPRTSVNTVNGHGDDLPIRNLSQYRADV